MFYSEKSPRILWQNPCFQNFMKTPRSLPNPFHAAVWIHLFTAGLVPVVAQDQPAKKPQATATSGVGAPEGAAAGDRPAASGRSAAAELKRAREMLTKHSSIRARLIEQVTLNDRTYRAEGRYLQLALKPGDWRMRLELTLKVGDSEGSLLEVCNGSVLQTRTEIDPGGSGKKKRENKELRISRRNVQEILDAARKSGDFSEETETNLLTSLGLGGLPALLASLEQDMKLGPPKEESIRDRPVIVLTGTWSEAVASRFRAPGSPAAPGLLPPTVPDQVRLYLDQQTGFPYRILYLKKLPNREVMKPMLTLDFRDVVLNEAIAQAEFEYEPPAGIESVDETNFYIQMLAPQAGAKVTP